MAKKKDTANVFSRAYKDAAPVLYKDIHKFLFDNISNFLTPLKGSKNFLVIGPGQDFLPFSKNKNKLKSMMGNGSIILLDYVFNSENVRKMALKLSQAGLINENYFEDGIRFDSSNGKLNPAELNPGTINYVNANLESSLGIVDNSIDCVDATLSIHHATPMIEHLDAVTGRIYKAMKNGGMFHYGTGNVDMKYSEKKIKKLFENLNEFLDEEIAVTDQRNSSKIETTKDFPYGKNIVIDKKGIVHISNSEGLPEYLKNMGYNVSVVKNEDIDEITLKLIDPKMSEDKKGMIIPVNAYYNGILAKLKNGYDSKKIKTKTFEVKKLALETERKLAIKGIVEYYTGKDDILKSLDKAGFQIAEVTHHKDDVFYNIIAMKNE